MKYIIQCWTENLETARTKSLFKAIKIKRKLKREKPDSYCCIIKIPFRKRHPDFPIWFSIASLLLVELSQEVGSYIHHILQTMRLWK